MRAPGLEPARGRLLVATPLLREPTFARTVVVLLEHDPDEGSFGVVLNRPLDVDGADVLPDVAPLLTPPDTLFQGGPVSPTTAVALGLLTPAATNTAPATADESGWAPVTGPLVTVDLDHDADALAGALRALRVFVGYAGWAAGQLDGEIEEGAWFVVDGLPLDPFGADPGRLWSAVLRRQGWPLAAVAVAPIDPGLN